jgi:hypothetical protein
MHCAIACYLSLNEFKPPNATSNRNIKAAANCPNLLIALPAPSIVLTTTATCRRRRCLNDPFTTSVFPTDRTLESDSQYPPPQQPVICICFIVKVHQLRFRRCPTKRGAPITNRGGKIVTAWLPGTQNFYPGVLVVSKSSLTQM